MDSIYHRFLPLLPENAHILDAGCGSGRDARVFIKRGYQVTAFDACIEMAAFAEKEIGQPVHVQCFQELEYENQFDGIWACASLLHVPSRELNDVFQRLARALKPNGVIYCSFKYGRGEHDRGGRRFTDMDEIELRKLIGQVDGVDVKALWVSGDCVSNREVNWLNLILVGDKHIDAENQVFSGS
ncbi:MAG TPA: class I SAM-dependent methyltransferase [Gammaproteobacteria bacterium]|nr:class I SAM-dependent methyltransferase [Gammaproteobacteria bacterium]